MSLLTSIKHFLQGRKLFIVRLESWTGYQTECLLRRYGIGIKDRFVCTVEKEFMPAHLSFTVSNKQAQFAEYIMLRAKVPVMTDQNTEDYASLPPGGNGTNNLDFMTRLVDFVTPFMGCEVGDIGHTIKTERRPKPKPPVMKHRTVRKKARS